MVYRWTNGRPVKLTLGRVGTLKLVDARRSAERAVAAIADGRDPVAERQAARSQGITMAELRQLWLDRRGDRLRPSSRRCFDSLWVNDVEPELGGKLVGRLARAEVQGLVDKVAKAGKPALARKISAVSSIPCWSRRCGSGS